METDCESEDESGSGSEDEPGSEKEGEEDTYLFQIDRDTNKWLGLVLHL